MIKLKRGEIPSKVSPGTEINPMDIFEWTPTQIILVYTNRYAHAKEARLNKKRLQLICNLEEVPYSKLMQFPDMYPYVFDRYFRNSLKQK